MNVPRGIQSFMRVWAVAVLLAARVVGSEAIDGVSYKNYVVDNVPWSIHVIKIERGRPEFEVVTTLGRGSKIGLGTLTRQLRTIPRDVGTPVAAINGDFYATEHDSYSGDPRGLHVLRGELISDPSDRTALWFDDRGNPHMAEVRSQFSVTWPNGENIPLGLNEGRSSSAAVLYTPAIGESTETRGGVEFILEAVSTNRWLPLKLGVNFPARVKQVRRNGDSPLSPQTMVLSVGPRRAVSAEVGDILMFSTVTDPVIKEVRTAIGGGPALVRRGAATSARATKSTQRHPRSAIGWNKTHLFFVEVDGRQHDLSVGMTLPELASFLVKIGCEEAMNLDGGGSAQVWLDGEIMNSPCYGRERSTATTIALIKKKVEAK
jgi:hypothetical protein